MKYRGFGEFGWVPAGGWCRVCWIWPTGKVTGVCWLCQMEARRQARQAKARQEAREREAARIWANL